MRRITTVLLFVVLIYSNTVGQITATDGWNYQKYPELTFNLDKMFLNLKVNPEGNEIGGKGRYQITSRRPALNTVILNTSDINIQSVVKGEEELEFRVSSDSLIIQLVDTLEMNQQTEFTITWISRSYYGIHKDINGTLWTSLNRNAIHHWLPVFDHPRIATSVEAEITIPADMQLAMNGEFVKDEVVSTNAKKVYMKSETPIPVNGLSLAVGPLVREEAMAGFKKVALFTPEGLLMDSVRSGLLRQAVSELRNLENKLTFEYPYEALNIVILPDHYWQEKQAGAGIIYLYQNLGSLTAQLKRALAGQWLGNYHRYGDLEDDIRKSEYLKVLLTGGNGEMILQNPDSISSVSYWNTWQESADPAREYFSQKVMKQSLPQLVKKFKGTVYWEDYAKYWYKDRGIYWQDIPDYNSPNGDQGEIEKFRYAVNAELDDLSGELTLIFRTGSNAAENLLGAVIKRYTFGGMETHTVTFTGPSDTLRLEYGPDTEFITVQAEDKTVLEIKEERFPLEYLLSKLRADDAGLREEAARQLQYHGGNPDLQLALNDILKDEENEQVRAAIFETLAQITSGDTGTEQTFLNALQSDNPDLKTAALKALANYKGNDQVFAAVRNMVMRTDSDTLFEKALKTFENLADTSAWAALSRSMERMEAAPTRTLKVLERALQVDTTGTVLEITDRFTRDSFPFAIRKQAFNLMMVSDNDPMYWEAKLQLMVSDPDPRMRYLSLKATIKLDKAQYVEMLNTRIKEEFDPRVSQRIAAIISL